jgi:hypothetical protein
MEPPHPGGARGGADRLGKDGLGERSSSRLAPAPQVFPRAAGRGALLKLYVVIRELEPRTGARPHLRLAVLSALLDARA